MQLTGCLMESMQGFSMFSVINGGGNNMCQDTQPDGKPLFRDILDSTVKAGKNNVYGIAGAEKDKKAADVAGSPYRIADGGNTDRNVEKMRPRSFREMVNGKMAESDKTIANEKAVPAENTDDSRTADEDDTSGTSADTAQAVVSCFAQILGISPGELETVLAVSGVTPEKLSGTKNIKDVADRLSAVLGLGSGQSDALEQVLELIAAQLDTGGGIMDAGPEVMEAGLKKDTDVSYLPDKSSVPEGTPDTSETTAGASAAGLPEAEIQAGPGDFAALAVKMKLKLDELEKKLETEKDGLADEISFLLKPAREKSVENVRIPVVNRADDDADAAASNQAPPDKKKSNVNEAGDGSVNGVKTEKTGAGKGDEAAKPAIGPVSTAVKADSVQSAVVDAGRLVKNDMQINTDKMVLKDPVLPKEIMNQVLEKAKLVLTGDKSEMVVELKPDSLGKLSLKVVTEHGMVMAKFVAESQQVKQVLEANMQTLRDSLEKQGLNVQGFSVSVRQDAHSGYDGRRYTAGQDNTVRTAAAYSEGKYIPAAGTGGIRQTNPYMWDASTINLTA